eukprot:5136226-Karenia_brevis.AAC.1
MHGSEENCGSSVLSTRVLSTMAEPSAAADSSGSQGSAQPTATAIAAEDIREALIVLLTGRDLGDVSVRSIRKELATRFSLPADGLDVRKQEIKDITQQ